MKKLVDFNVHSYTLVTGGEAANGTTTKQAMLADLNEKYPLDEGWEFEFQFTYNQSLIYIGVTCRKFEIV